MCFSLRFAATLLCIQMVVKKILIKYIVVHLGYELRVSTDAGLYLTKTTRVIVFQSAVKAYVCSFSTRLHFFHFFFCAGKMCCRHCVDDKYSLSI